MDIRTGEFAPLTEFEKRGVPKQLVRICGSGTILRDPRPSLADPGKWRSCERPKGHAGRHMAHYCGLRRYWKNTA